MPQSDQTAATSPPLAAALAPAAALPAAPAVIGRPAALAALFAIGAAWGATIVTGKIAVSTGHHPLGLVFWQLVISVLALAPLALARRRLPAFGRRTLGFFLVVALVGTLVPNTFSYAAAAKLPAGVLAILISAVPMTALGIAWAAGVERPTATRIVGVALGFVAVLMLLGPEASLPEPAAWPFVLVGLAAPLCYGVEGVYVKLRMPAGTDAVAALLGASLVGLLLLSPVLALAPGLRVPFPGPFGAPEKAILISGVLHAGSYAGYVWLVGAAGPVFASMVSYIVTLSGVFWGMAVLGESHSAWIWAALAAMVAGMALVQPRR